MLQLPAQPQKGFAARRKLVWVISLIEGTYLIRGKPGVRRCGAAAVMVESAGGAGHSVQPWGLMRQLLPSTGTGRERKWDPYGNAVLIYSSLHGAHRWVTRCSACGPGDAP